MLIRQIKGCLFLPVLFLANTGFAQNWVLNGGFEERNVCREYKAQCAPEAWFHFPVSEPFLPAQLPEAHSGLAAETVVVENFEHPVRYRIFLYTRLICPLQAGQEYTLVFYLYTLGYRQLPLGVLLSGSAPEEDAPGFFSAPPTLLLGPENQVSGGKYGWREMEIRFIARGGEEFLTFGNFNPEALQPLGSDKDDGHDAIFMLDDIELRSAKGPECPNLEARKISIYQVDDRHIDHLVFEKFELPADTMTLVAEPAPMEQADIPRAFILSDIGFDFGQYALRPLADSLLRSCAEQMILRKIVAVRIAGYTDDVGSDDFNRDLSLKRAEAVRQWFVERYHLPASMFEVEGLGEGFPVAPNDTEAGRQANRRVVITFIR